MILVTCRGEPSSWLSLARKSPRIGWCLLINVHGLLTTFASLLHALTAAFHEVKDHHRKTKAARAEEEKVLQEQDARV